MGRYSLGDMIMHLWFCLQMCMNVPMLYMIVIKPGFQYVQTRMAHMNAAVELETSLGQEQIVILALVRRHFRTPFWNL